MWSRCFPVLLRGFGLGGAEAPTKLVIVGLSPYVISLTMVAGVFLARWTLPTVLKGTGYVFLDLRARAHLVIWAILAGALWAVANTLTVFAIRDVGLSVAFPLWNINSLVGLFWGGFCSTSCAARVLAS
jgi:predicted nicotinamide N-methyase